MKVSSTPAFTPGFHHAAVAFIGTSISPTDAVFGPVFRYSDVFAEITDIPVLDDLE